MNVKFSKTEQDNVPVDVKTEPVQTPVPGLEVPAVTTAAPPARTNSSGFPLGDDLPGFKDVMFPRINIVYDVGGLKDTFTPGELVFGKQTVLFSPPVNDKKTGNTVTPALPPVNITVIGIVSKRFSEKIQGGVGGMIVNTEEEVRANGGTLDYNEWNLKKASGMKRFENLIDMLVAIRRPAHIKDDDTVFTFPVGDQKYALGLWAVKGTAYTHAYKQVLAYARLAGVLKQGYPTHSFALTTRIESNKNSPNPYWVPILVPDTKSTPEFMEFVKQIVNPTA